MKYLIIIFFFLSIGSVYGQDVNAPQSSSQNTVVFKHRMPSSGSTASSQASVSTVGRPGVDRPISPSGGSHLGDCDRDCQLRAKENEQLRFAQGVSSTYTSTPQIPATASSSVDRGTGHLFAAIIVGLIGVITLR